MNSQKIIVSDDLELNLKQLIFNIAPDKIFILTDECTHRLCMPLLSEFSYLDHAEEIVIGEGELHKTLETLANVWAVFSNEGASRHSLLINLGGGMVTDLGGFAAATFKRGFTYINIPTSLLGVVDASVGGKTGINFNGLKNEVGAFTPPKAVVIYTEFLKTLDKYNFFSGYAEMLKHGLISSKKHLKDLLAFDILNVDYEMLRMLAAHSVHTKEEVVAKDPYEYGIRKALNFGHTVGHAFESLAMAKGHPLLHGYAVAWGIVCELYLSVVKTGFPKDKMKEVIHFIRKNYGAFYIDCDQYETLFEYMLHDKKNVSSSINFTLLEDVGEIRINQTANKELIFEMFDFYRECMGI